MFHFQNNKPSTLTSNSAIDAAGVKTMGYILDNLPVDIDDALKKVWSTSPSFCFISLPDPQNCWLDGIKSNRNASKSMSALFKFRNYDPFRQEKNHEMFPYYLQSCYIFNCKEENAPFCVSKLANKVKICVAFVGDSSLQNDIHIDNRIPALRLLYEKCFEFRCDPSRLFQQTDQTTLNVVTIPNAQVAVVDGSSLLKLVGQGIIWVYHKVGACDDEQLDDESFFKTWLPGDTITEIVCDHDIMALLDGYVPLKY